jgi:hypothetical protein
MAQDREATTDRAPFFKFAAIGQAVAGHVFKYGNNDNGGFIEMRPVMVRDGRGEQWEKQEGPGIAVGLSTDLGMKITSGDVGRFLLIEFNDTEPAKRGQPRKVFRVIEMTKAEIIGLRDGSFIIPEAPPRKVPDSLGAASGSSVDDLF